MVNTYSAYRKMAKDTLNFEECEAIHKKIAEAISDDPDGLDIYKDLLEKAREYTVKRLEWRDLDIAGRGLAGERRSDVHNSLLRHYVMLYRFCKQQGLDTAWYTMLGDIEQDSAFRKRYGDFAGYLCFIEMACQR